MEKELRCPFQQSPVDLHQVDKHAHLKASMTTSPADMNLCSFHIHKGAEHSGLDADDSIDPKSLREAHWVYTSCPVESVKWDLSSCVPTDACRNPTIHVVAQVLSETDTRTHSHVTADAHPPLSNDFNEWVLYKGSSTGKKLDNECSPYQITWQVQRKVGNITSQNLKLLQGPNALDGARRLFEFKH